MFFTVYKITNLLNAKYYVGMHKTQNLDDGYMGSGKVIRRAIEKHGVENFKKEYLAIFNNENNMRLLESEIVTKEFIQRADTYNLKEGGRGGFDYINNTKANIPNMRKAWERNKWLLENDKEFKASFVENCRKATKAYTDDPAKAAKWRGKMHSTMQRRYGTTSGFKGKAHSEGAKGRIGAANSEHQKGGRNSQFGTCWVYNMKLKESKRIKKEDITIWINKGWIKGRKIKF